MKILVVDDEQDIKTLFEQRFRNEIKSGQVEFIFSYSGEDALVQLNRWEHQAMLILSDINMPGMSGLQLLENVKKKYMKPPPVVMMITAYGDTENLRIANELGADDFLTKPLDFIKLKEKLNLNKG